MKILAIETSCDETACAIVEDGRRILSDVVVSQVDIFAAYGGVIPEVAARSHLEVMLPVVQKALEDAGLTKEGIDAIAVTHTPGLLGSLLIGTLTARMLAILWGKPLYAVHHLKSHIYANWLGSDQASIFPSEHCAEDQPTALPRARLSRPVVTGETALKRSPLVATGPKQRAAWSQRQTTPIFPLLALVVSGGHTQIIYMRGHNSFKIIGTTRDDAVGECFDKVAKILGLLYPGGPSIAREALMSCSQELPKLPHPRVDGLDFSFSGLKTAVLRAVQNELGVPINTPSYELAGKLTEVQRADFAASFQETACDILIEKLKMALAMHPEVRSVVLAGGVSANQRLREKIVDELTNKAGNLEKKQGQSEDELVNGLQVGVYFPEIQLAGDNAAMVGAAAYFEIISGVKPTDPYNLDIAPRTAIG